MTDHRAYKNAVLDDKELQAGLKAINPKFGELVTRVAGELWGLPLIDQKTKALITIAVDVVNQSHRGAGNPFPAHVNMALQQGATREEIEELLLFMCAYAGFNKVAGCFGTLNEILAANSVEQRKSAMITATKKADYSTRDRKGNVAFYVLLWKRKGITLELFDNYWKDVHGPVCARLPGQYQYWQFHLARNEGGLWPNVEGVECSCPEEDQFDGIAELTFETEADRQTWFKAAAILMDDEHNLFSKAIGYNTSPSNSQTYIDGIATGDPNGAQNLLKFHVLVRKSPGVSADAFRQYMKDTFAPSVTSSDSVLKFRLHLFEEVDNSRPDAAGVVHYEPAEKQYQASFEMAFSNSLEMEKFFASKEYVNAVKDMAKYVTALYPFPERTTYTFVYDGKMTLAGERSAKVAELITNIGATNQLREDIVSLMSGKMSQPNSQQNGRPGLGHYLQGVQHIGVTVSDMKKSLEFYTEVLGGKLVIPENGLVGDDMQNTLFQKEELDALAQGQDPRNIDIPKLRDGKDALDIKFISFGNTCVELIYFRDGANPNASKTSVSAIPSHIGHVNAMHLSFHVKEDIDLSEFADILEQECHKRGMTDVICNRIVNVKSEAERRAVALKYNSFKFWEEEDFSSNGHAENHFGDFEGWALFYCKGPNGEQLEFNQVTRKVKNKFIQAQQEYNQANGTSFTFPEGKISPITQQQGGTMTEEKLPGKNIDLVKRLFSRGEAFDSEGFVTFFTDTPVYQFGNFDVCLDKQSIKKSADNFFSQINAVYHEIKAMWEVGDVVFVEMDVAYWRKDGSMISLPCSDIFRVEGDKFSELRIFMDVNPVFNPTIPVPSSASVLTVSQGKRMVPPGTMRRHFAEHPEGKERVAKGYVPKWAIDGPKWSIGPETSAFSSQVQVAAKISECVIQGKWEELKDYLTDDVFYKVGSGEPVYGKQAVADFLSTLVRTTAKFQSHNVRKIWDEPGVVMIEMDANYLRLRDQKKIKIACSDIYRLRGNQVSEWRVYADMAPFYEP